MRSRESGEGRRESCLGQRLAATVDENRPAGGCGRQPPANRARRPTLPSLPDRRGPAQASLACPACTLAAFTAIGAGPWRESGGCEVSPARAGHPVPTAIVGRVREKRREVLD